MVIHINHARLSPSIEIAHIEAEYGDLFLGEGFLFWVERLPFPDKGVDPTDGLSIDGDLLSHKGRFHRRTMDDPEEPLLPVGNLLDPLLLKFEDKGP